MHQAKKAPPAKSRHIQCVPLCFLICVRLVLACAQTWLYNAAPYGGVAKQTQAGGIAQVAMSAIVAGAALAAALVFA